MKKPEMIIDLSGPEGNIYVILAKASDILHKQHRINDFNELRDKVYASHSHGEALKNVIEYINIIDTSENNLLEKYLKSA